MIYVHSMERALRYHPGQLAWRLGEDRLNFRELHEQVKRLAATLTHLGFKRTRLHQVCLCMRLAWRYRRADEYTSLRCRD